MNLKCINPLNAKVDGRSWKWIHFTLAILLIILWFTAAHFNWLVSVKFVSHISMLALVLAEVSSWQGARVEQKQDEQKYGKDVVDDNDDPCYT